MALRDKRNKLYLSNRKVELSSQCERKGKVHIDLIRQGKRTTRWIRIKKAGGGWGGGHSASPPWRLETRKTDCM